MKYRWSVAPGQPTLAAELATRLGIRPLLAQCLLNRHLMGTEAISAFLQPRLRHLTDPFLLPNMAAAVDRLLRARSEGQPLVIFGDYDVDGVTSTALLLLMLRELGWTVEYYLPHRLDEGYGLSQEAVENCLRKFPVKLLMAVDCGSTSTQTIHWLAQSGIEVIVLDHHQVAEPPPPAVALVNPQLQLSSLRGTSLITDGTAEKPFCELCSVGLAFKLAHALVKRGRQCGLPGAAGFDLRPLLDLVALGTIADLVPLTGENRILVCAGLDRLKRTQRPGLQALKQVAQCPASVGTYEVGFQLAPRLNAAGRLETAEIALRLLLSKDSSEGLSLANQLDVQNRERRQIERAISEQALVNVQARFKPEADFVIVEGDALWHVGVVGIVASRVLQRFYRPTIIVGGDGEVWRGSGRSIAGFDLASALRECGDLLERHGGHAMAAGLTLRPDRLDSFRNRLNEVARRMLTRDLLEPVLPIDAEVTLGEMSFECLAHLEQLKPAGQGNPAVHFCARNLTHRRPAQRVGSDRRHVKMWVQDGTGAQETVWWGAGNDPVPEGTFDLAFIPHVNEFDGRRTVQLKLLDWQVAQPTAPVSI